MTNNDWVVDGWITIQMTAEQAERWNAGTLTTSEIRALRATLPEDGRALARGTIGELLAAGEITEDDLAWPGVFQGSMAQEAN